MKTRIFIILICSLGLVGCATNIASRKLDIVPGKGIAEVAYLGMHAQDVARNTCNGVVTEVTGESGYSAQVPSLGIFWNQEDTRDGIIRLSVLVDPSVYGPNCQRQKLQRFCGTLCGTLSMAKPKALTKQRLLSAFGPPNHSFDLSAAGVDNFEKVMHEFGTSVRQGQSTSLRTTPITEILIYPSRGIEFWMADNVVHTIEIMNKVEQGTAPLPSAPQVGPSEGAR